jgi:hypothetical protein
MEAVGTHFEGVKPLFDVVSLAIVQLTAQSQSREGSPIAITLDEKLCFGEVVFLGKSMKECCGSIGPAVAAQLDVQQEF